MGGDVEKLSSNGFCRTSDPGKLGRRKKSNWSRTSNPSCYQRRSARLHKNGIPLRCEIPILWTRGRKSSMSKRLCHLEHAQQGLHDADTPRQDREEQRRHHPATVVRTDCNSQEAVQERQ